MGSYLAEVLSSVEKMEFDQINKQCPEVATSVGICRTQVLEYLSNVYVNFSEDLWQKNSYLNDKIKSLGEDTTRLITNVENISRYDENKVREHVKMLTQTRETLETVSALYGIHEDLIKAQELETECAFPECMRKILEVEENFKKLKSDLEDNLELCEGLMVNIAEIKGYFFIKMSNLFDAHVILKAEKKKRIFQVKMDGEMKQVLQTLFSTMRFKCILDKVTYFLWKGVLVPIMESTTRITITTHSGFAILEVMMVDSDHRPQYSEVFTNLKKVLEFLTTNFDFQVDEELSSLRLIGNTIRDDLSELLIKNCLQQTVPSTTEGLERYPSVIKATEELEKALVKAQIFVEGPTPVLNYVNNIQVHFINKKCQQYITAAFGFMKRPLDDFLEVGPGDGFSEVDFPKCAISRSVVDLLGFMDKMLQEMPSLSLESKRRLFCTIKVICRKYGTVVPVHHKELLENLPQQNALFYNNCMYIKNTLSRWNDTHVTKLPPDLNLPNNFGDEGRQLGVIANKKFASYVDAQIQQTHELIKDFGLNKCATEKAVYEFRQQVKKLKTSWDNILPEDLANKSLGVIVDACVEFFASKKLEILPVDDGELKMLRSCTEKKSFSEKWNCVDKFLNQLLDKVSMQ